MSLQVGYDPGRMYSKLFTVINDHSIRLKGPNVICLGYERRDMNVEEEIKLKDEDLLDVTITEGDKSERWFVGEYARKYNRSDLLTVSPGTRKFSERNAKRERIKFYTYLALAAKQSGLNELKPSITLGAPTEEFYHKDGRKEIEKFRTQLNLVKIKFNHPKFCGYEVKLTPERLDCAPEGTASSYSAKYDIDPVTFKLIENEWMKAKLMIGPVYISNLGSTTEDGTLLTKKGFDTRGSFGIDIGSSIATSALLRMLKEEYNLKKDKTTIDYYLQMTAPENKPIKYADNYINLNDLVKPHYDVMLDRRIQMINDSMYQNGIDTGEIVAQFQTGGTIDYLKMVGMQDQLKIFSHAELMISADPHFDEARGYYIIGKLQEEIRMKAAAEKFKDKSNPSTEEDEIEIEIS